MVIFTPTEIQFLVLSHITEICYLLSMRLVCKNWKQELDRKIFEEHIFIPNGEDFMRVIRPLALSPIIITTGDTITLCSNLHNLTFITLKQISSQKQDERILGTLSITHYEHFCKSLPYSLFLFKLKPHNKWGAIVITSTGQPIAILNISVFTINMADLHIINAIKARISDMSNKQNITLQWDTTLRILPFMKRCKGTVEFKIWTCDLTPNTLHIKMSNGPDISYLFYAYRSGQEDIFTTDTFGTRFVPITTLHQKTLIYTCKVRLCYIGKYYGLSESSIYIYRFDFCARKIFVYLDVNPKLTVIETIPMEDQADE